MVQIEERGAHSSPAAPRLKESIVERACKLACVAALIVMLVVIGVDILTRSLFNFSFEISDELGGYLLVVICFVSLPVCVASDWQGATPTLPAGIEVASHAACDLSPIDLSSPASALRLAAYVWPDQRERLERLRAAIALAQYLGVQVERADALDWVGRELSVARPGQATVLYHSIMWQYMAQGSRDALREMIAAAGKRATRDAPLAWLAFEPLAANANPQLLLTLWPGGQRHVLAEAHPHGRWVRWARTALTAPDP